MARGAKNDEYLKFAANRTDQKLRNSPRHMAKVNMIVPLLQKRLFAGLDAQYTGTRLTEAGTLVGGFPMFNVTMLGRALGKHADLSGSIYNLFDRKYSDPAAVAGQPRTRRGQSRVITTPAATHHATVQKPPSRSPISAKSSAIHSASGTMRAARANCTGANQPSGQPDGRGRMPNSSAAVG